VKKVADHNIIIQQVAGKD